MITIIITSVPHRDYDEVKHIWNNLIITILRLKNISIYFVTITLCQKLNEIKWHIIIDLLFHYLKPISVTDSHINDYIINEYYLVVSIGCVDHN